MGQDKERTGVFIVIEGTDGSGKGTQFALLAKRLQEQGYDVATFDFPQYDKESSYFVRQYLNGHYGTAEEVGPYTGSLFYALDRYEAAANIRQALSEGKVVLANRFTGSNMAHQGTKFNNHEERRGYFIWLDNLEFVMLKVPRPDKSFVLRVPADIAQQLVDQKEARSYTDKKRDLHEADLSHLQRAVEVYDDMCQLFPRDFQRIDCVRSGSLLSIEAVSDLLWETVVPFLPTKPDHPTSSALGTTPNPYIQKDALGQSKITQAGSDFLNNAVTDVSGNIYAFTNTLSPTLVATAMARLSRRGDDLRHIILEEFAQANNKDNALLHRVITEYGDDSVQQLVSLHMVVEKASNLLTKKLEWGRLAAYLEQSTRYIYFDQKDASGEYQYHTPSTFGHELRGAYQLGMNTIFDKYSELVSGLATYLQQNSATPEAERDTAWRNAIRAQACDAARPVLPVATTATVGIHASGQAIENLIMNLLGDALPEAQQAGKELLVQARKVIPTFLERTDLPERGGATSAYRATNRTNLKQLANDLLPGQFGQYEEPVRLTGVWPRNELDLVADMLYEHSHLSLKEIEEQVANWPYDTKVSVLNAYIGERLNRRQRPGRALEKAHYSWDIVCDYGIFRDLQRHRMVDDLQWQQLTPRYGYEMPKLVEDAGLSELFEDCFDISLRLHSELQAAGYDDEAQYATLLGHRMRWKVTYNARQAFHIHELRTSPQGHPGYRKLVKEMHNKLAEAHPLIAEAMRFVNHGDDPELTRLAAERYNQFKQLQAKQTPPQ